MDSIARCQGHCPHPLRSIRPNSISEKPLRRSHATGLLLLTALPSIEFICAIPFEVREPAVRELSYLHPHDIASTYVTAGENPK